MTTTRGEYLCITFGCLALERSYFSTWDDTSNLSASAGSSADRDDLMAGGVEAAGRTNGGKN